MTEADMIEAMARVICARSANEHRWKYLDRPAKDRFRHRATAAIAVVQPEIDRLRAENEGLRRERDEAQEVADNAVEQTAVMRASLEYAEQQKLMALNNELLTRAESSEALVAELREKVVDLTHREKVRSEAINRSLTDANERADAAQARADLAIKLFDQREEYLSGLIARNAELRENNARLREALEPFAKRAERYDPDEADDGEPDWSTASPSIRIGDLRRARSELEGR